MPSRRRFLVLSAFASVLVLCVTSCAVPSAEKATHDICEPAPVSTAFSDMNGGYSNHQLEALLPVDLEAQKKAAAKISKIAIFYGCHIEVVRLDPETKVVLVRVTEQVFSSIQKPLQEKFSKKIRGQGTILVVLTRLCQ